MHWCCSLVFSPAAGWRIPIRDPHAGWCIADSTPISSSCTPTSLLTIRPCNCPLQVLLMPWLALVHLASSPLLLLAWGACAVLVPLVLGLFCDWSCKSSPSGTSSSVRPATAAPSAPLGPPGEAPAPRHELISTRVPAVDNGAAPGNTQRGQLYILVRLLCSTAGAVWLGAAPVQAWGRVPQQRGLVVPLVLYLWSCWQGSLLLVSVRLTRGRF
jgi:hypothetical protein